MNQEQTRDKCKHYAKPECKYKDDELMKNLVNYLEPRQYTPKSKGPEYGKMQEEVNKKLCNNCDSFEKKSRE